jgi:tetratricopeptide (TPR) repeat protein
VCTQAYKLNILKLINIFFLMVICGTYALAQDSEIKIANEYFNNGEFEKARVSFEKLAKNQQNLPVIYNNYLNTLIYLKQIDPAEKFIKKMIKSFPDNITYKTDHYILISEKDGQEKTNKEFQNIINEVKNDPERVEKLADYLSKRGRYQNARDLMLASRKALNDKYVYALSLSRIYRALNQPALLIEELLNYAKEVPAALESVRNTFQNNLSSSDFALLETELYARIQKDPDELAYNELLLWLNIQQRNFGRAFIQAKAIDKRNKRSGDKVIEVGRIALDNHDYDNAIRYFEYVVAEYPFHRNNSELARKLLINTKEEMIRNTFPVDKAKISSLVNDYKKLIRDAGRSVVALDAMRNIAQLEAFYLDNKDTAVIILNDAIKSAVNDAKFIARAKLDLGDIYLLKGEPWEATLIYSQVEKSQKDEPLGHEAKLRNAKLAYYTGEFELAQATLDVLKLATSREIANDAMDLSILIQDNIALDTSDEAMREYAAIDLLLFQNKNTEALERLDKMLKKYPDHSLTDEILFLKADLYKKQGDFDNALKNLEQINTSYAYDILGDDALFSTGMIYEENLHNKEKAMEIYQSFLGKFPGSIFTAEARKRFRLLRGDKMN